MAIEASIFVFTPKRVTLAELDQLRAEEAEVARLGVNRLGSCYSVSSSSPAAVAADPCSPCPHLAENLDLRCQAGYWRSMFQRCREREELAKQRIAELEAEVRDLKHRVFGRKSESAASRKTSPAGTSPPCTPRPRGQPRGKP